jgi:poly-gamma-glutamate capsule biosynthesis protein CapA/YwtB (metallophosphatase superfamily)
VVPAGNAAGLKASGLRAINCATNHTVDGGHAALLSMLETLHGLGIETFGAGDSLTEARRPAIFEAAGRRVGLLGYTACSRRATRPATTCRCRKSRSLWSLIGDGEIAICAVWSFAGDHLPAFGASS